MKPTKKFNYSFDSETGILECFLFSLTSEDIKKEEQEVRLGLKEKEDQEDIPFTPLRSILDLSNSIITTIIEIEHDLYEEGNKVKGVSVEFFDHTYLDLIISFDDFKEIYKNLKNNLNATQNKYIFKS